MLLDIDANLSLLYENVKKYQAAKTPNGKEFNLDISKIDILNSILPFGLSKVEVLNSNVHGNGVFAKNPSKRTN